VQGLGDKCNDVNFLSHLKYDINILLETWKGTEPNFCIQLVGLPMQSVPVITDIMSSNQYQARLSCITKFFPGRSANQIGVFTSNQIINL
jgi:hypothetical protein